MNGKPLPKEKDKPRNKKKKSISKLKKELDSIFSKFIRLRDNGQCYTCFKQDHYKNMQNGHFVPRQYLKTRYDEINCHCQCYACNMLYNGQPSRYALNLERDYGTGTVSRLEASRGIPIKDFPYEEKISYYTLKVEEFYQSKGYL